MEQDSYAGTWNCGCTLTGLSWVYPDKNDPSVMHEVIAIAPDELDEEGIDYDLVSLSQDHRKFFLRTENLEEIARDKLLCHAINFRQFACKIAKACGNSSAQLVSDYPIFEDELIRLFELPVPTYFAFVFGENALIRCLDAISSESPQRSIVFVLGNRWDSQSVRKEAVNKCHAKLIPLEKVMSTTKGGFKWINGYTWEQIRSGASYHGISGTRLPNNATWEDILVVREEEDVIAFYFERDNLPIQRLTSFNYRDESMFFSSRRNAQNMKTTKPAYDLLLLYIAMPETRMIPKDVIERAKLNEEEARSALRKVLRARLPQLSHLNPFEKKRRKEEQGVYRLFKVKGLEEKSRQIQETMREEAGERT